VRERVGVFGLFGGGEGVCVNLCMCPVCAYVRVCAWAHEREFVWEAAINKLCINRTVWDAWICVEIFNKKLDMG
jgi:hypothetical protein